MVTGRSDRTVRPLASRRQHKAGVLIPGSELVAHVIDDVIKRESTGDARHGRVGLLGENELLEPRDDLVVGNGDVDHVDRQHSGDDTTQVLQLNGTRCNGLMNTFYHFEFPIQHGLLELIRSWWFIERLSRNPVQVLGLASTVLGLGQSQIHGLC